MFRIDNLACGFNDSKPGYLISDCEATEIVNFHVDRDSLGLLQRKGSEKTNPDQLAGKSEVDAFTYVQQDADEFILVHTSVTIAFSSDNGLTFETLITTATDGTDYDGVTFIDDKFYMVSQDDGGFAFDGTDRRDSGSIPSVKF